ncbi:ubiquitin and ribosomal protein s27a [Moniliophthora roreri MCA 2997]|uniref:Ubiquitin and ribosomal protein s27a n=1 Tax=Moniliophthora roreri (strain MCA 2997) TaxID=1381753 RepID=V2WUX0_MONRO|nr:ubiquitin and ribosomal protein s27a [Moniliophthora roreri MCA 2997]
MESKRPNTWILTLIKTTSSLSFHGATLMDGIAEALRFLFLELVDDIYYRNLYDVIQTEIQLPYAHEFVWKPYKLFFKLEGAPIQRVYGEAYTLDRALEFEREIMSPAEEIRKNLPTDKKNVEIGVVLIIFHSDGMMLASFGTASLWPVYMKLANWSKYPSLKTDSLAWSHITYFPSIPPGFQDIYGEHFKAAASSKELRHVKIELLQAVWYLLLNDPPLSAFFSIDSSVIPLIMSKMMLMTMKYLSKYLCLLCLTKKCEVYQLGLKQDMTCRETKQRHDSEDLRKRVDESTHLVYKRGWGVDSEAVNNKLKLGSYLRIQNTFSNLFFEHGLDYPQMFGPNADYDTWGRIRDLLLHNMRILIARKDKGDKKLNQRYQCMKQLAGRDLEDILQCALPCYEGLFIPCHDNIIQDLLFTFATWHSYCAM